MCPGARSAVGPVCRPLRQRWRIRWAMPEAGASSRERIIIERCSGCSSRY